MANRAAIDTLLSEIGGLIPGDQMRPSDIFDDLSALGRVDDPKGTLPSLSDALSNCSSAQYEQYLEALEKEAKGYLAALRQGRFNVAQLVEITPLDPQSDTPNLVAQKRIIMNRLLTDHGFCVRPVDKSSNWHKYYTAGYPTLPVAYNLDEELVIFYKNARTSSDVADVRKLEQYKRQVERMPYFAVDGIAIHSHWHRLYGVKAGIDLAKSPFIASPNMEGLNSGVIKGFLQDATEYLTDSSYAD